MKHSACILALAALVSSGSNAQARFFPDTGKAAIDEYLEQAVQETYIPGLIAMVTDRDGVIYGGAFGSQDVAQTRPMTLDSIVRIASMTKPLTSAGVMMLIEDGQLGLDDPVSAHLPGLLAEDVFETFDRSDNSFTTRPVHGDLSVYHLLTHTSGLGYANFNEILFRLLGSQSPPPSGLDYPLLHDPGVKWTYGESTRVLGLLLEHVSGQPLDAFLRERIFVPLGMHDTGYAVPSEDQGRVATYHIKRGQILAEQPNPQGAIRVAVRGDGNLFSTASDYTKFIRMILNEGRGPNEVRLLDEATVESMAQNHLGDLRVEFLPAANTAVTRTFPLGAGRDGFGLGFQITGAHENINMRSPGSLSWAGIYNTQFWIDPRTGIGAVLLMQYLPFYDRVAIQTLQGFEERVYRYLQ